MEEIWRVALDRLNAHMVNNEPYIKNVNTDIVEKYINDLQTKLSKAESIIKEAKEFAKNNIPLEHYSRNMILDILDKE